MTFEIVILPGILPFLRLIGLIFWFISFSEFQWFFNQYYYCFGAQLAIFTSFGVIYEAVRIEAEK